MLWPFVGAASLMEGGVDERHRDRSHTDRLTVAGAREDDVLHPATAETPGGLLSQNPANCVAQVRFAAPVRPDNGRNSLAVKAHFLPVAE